MTSSLSPLVTSPAVSNGSSPAGDGRPKTHEKSESSTTLSPTATMYGTVSTQPPPPPTAVDTTKLQDDVNASPKTPMSPQLTWAWGRHDSLLPRKTKKGESQDSLPLLDRTPALGRNTPQSADAKGGIFYYLVYAVVNVIIGVPGLYGYAAVIFNHPVFQPHMNALSKLVLFSSLLHQLGFALFSTLPFAIGTVQDAGLIFLSSMANYIADTILDDGGTEAQVISTTLVLLSGGTACLGLVLIAMGRFKLANAVSYLPMPVVGGYLAFIGYFCLQAGVALCISKAMIDFSDWKYLFNGRSALLAFPGLVAAFLFTYISRNASNDAALPTAMVVVPAVFYLIVYLSGMSFNEAREAGWVGEEAPPVPVTDLFKLVDFSLVQWDLVSDLLMTWVGMVFVVSFASCLDVAAISMDMGEALDTNKELATVGICNVMSGLAFGFTGSYIFSQTIFTYRTGVHSKWIGILVMVAYLYIVLSPMNILQVAPLFFLGSTLIFIGYDLLYEWLFEIRHKIFLSEYIIVLATFVSIQIVGIDAGIVIGVLVSLVDHVVTSASTTDVNRVAKKSRAVWSPEEYEVLKDQGYHPQFPRIMTLEVVGTVFFGSSLHLFQRLTEEVNVDTQTDFERNPSRSPRTPSYILTNKRAAPSKKATLSTVMRKPPKFVVLDLTQLSNLDASASRGCFLQFAKVCAKRGIIVCAAGPSARVGWMFRSHDVSYSLEEEDRIKAIFQSNLNSAAYDKTHKLPAPPQPERILLFLTTYEALEFCENALLRRTHSRTSTPLSHILGKREQISLASVFENILHASPEETNILQHLDGKRYHDEINYRAGDVIFQKNTHADAFYVVLKGAVAVASDSSGRRPPSFRKKQSIVSGAGPVRMMQSSSDLLDPALLDESMRVVSLWPVGGTFGYVDFHLHRPRVFRAVASNDNTVCAKISHSHLNLLQNEDPKLDALVQRVLLHASVMDLANCTCDE